MTRTRPARWALLMLLALVVAACGGGDEGSADDADPTALADDDAPATDAGEEADDAAPTGLPAECVEAPFEVSLTMDAVPAYAGGTFPVTSAVGVATPIVPNGDESLDPEEIDERGAETDLLLYTQWIGDHPFTADDLGLFSGPQPPEGAVTFALSVVPTTESGLATGDVLSDSDDIEFDAITTFGTVGVYLQAADGVETFLMVDNLDENQGGTVEIMYLDDDWLCARWDLAGATANPDGTYALSGVILTEIERSSTPFT